MDESNKIILESLDDIAEYGNSVDIWVAMHEESEKERTGSNSFGHYTLHVFDRPVEVSLTDGTVLDTFQAAILVQEPGDMATRDTYALTYPSEAEALAQLEEINEAYQDFWMAEEAKEQGMEV
jgi:hypothetical protein